MRKCPYRVGIYCHLKCSFECPYAEKQCYIEDFLWIILKAIKNNMRD
ncbi:MAG: hypothetical protein ACFFDH_24845 [Promethearchaeota archaeon]